MKRPKLIKGVKTYPLTRIMSESDYRDLEALAFDKGYSMQEIMNGLNQEIDKELNSQVSS